MESNFPLECCCVASSILSDTNSLRVTFELQKILRAWVDGQHEIEYNSSAIKVVITNLMHNDAIDAGIKFYFVNEVGLSGSDNIEEFSIFALNSINSKAISSENDKEFIEKILSQFVHRSWAFEYALRFFLSNHIDRAIQFAKKQSSVKSFLTESYLVECTDRFLDMLQEISPSKTRESIIKFRKLIDCLIVLLTELSQDVSRERVRKMTETIGLSLSRTLIVPMRGPNESDILKCIEENNT